MSDNKKNKLSEINNQIKNCLKCDLFKTRINSLSGEGNINAKLMLIAQAPGENEDRIGKMFIGPSGEVLNELLIKAKILRQDIYITNLIKCYLPKCRRPKIIEIYSFNYYLDLEISIINPRFIIPLGYYAGKYIFEKYDLEVTSKKDFKINFGKLFWTGEIKIYPLQHPASILHKPELKKVLIKNYKKLRIFSNYCKWHLSCPINFYIENGRINKSWQELYCKGDWESCSRYHLEESGEYHPDWMLPDGSIDESLKY